MSGKPVVAHIKQAYVGLSETFIHRLVAGIRQFRPIVLTEEILNEGNFQFSRYYQVSQVATSDTWPQRIAAKSVRLFNSSLEYYPVHVGYSYLLAKHKAKLIHAHFGSTGWFCLPLQKLHRVPLVVSFHGFDASALTLQSVWRSRYQELFRKANCITAPSVFMAKSLEELGCNPDKIKVIHYGLDLDEWPHRGSNNGRASSPYNVLMVARFTEKKGITYGIEAISRIVERFPTVRLRIVGDGPLRSEIENLLARLAVDRHVELLGPRSNSEVASLMRESDVLIVPSVTAADGDREGLPVVLIEAAATGLPVVATCHAGIPEIVRDGISGFLVPERDPDALARKLVLLLEDEELRTRMGRAGRCIVVQEFDIASSTEKLEQIYCSLLGGAWLPRV